MVAGLDVRVNQLPIVRHYRGANRADVEAAYRADAQPAIAAGYLPVGHAWTQDHTGLLLAVTYQMQAAPVPAAPAYHAQPQHQAATPQAPAMSTQFVAQPQAQPGQFAPATNGAATALDAQWLAPVAPVAAAPAPLAPIAPPTQVAPPVLQAPQRYSPPPEMYAAPPDMYAPPAAPAAPLPAPVAQARGPASDPPRPGRTGTRPRPGRTGTRPRPDRTRCACRALWSLDRRPGRSRERQLDAPDAPDRPDRWTCTAPANRCASSAAAFRRAPSARPRAPPAGSRRTPITSDARSCSSRAATATCTARSCCRRTTTTPT